MSFFYQWIPSILPFCQPKLVVEAFQQARGYFVATAEPFLHPVFWYLHQHLQEKSEKSLKRKQVIQILKQQTVQTMEVKLSSQIFVDSLILT